MTTPDFIDAGISMLMILLTLLACIGIIGLIIWFAKPLLDIEEDE